MNSRICTIGIVGALLGSIHFDRSVKAEEKAAPKEAIQPRILETVNLAPGKAITPKDQARVSSLALKVLGHVSKAQQDIHAKQVDGAKKELTQAEMLLRMLKEVLPTVKVVDHIWLTKSDLSYLNTTEVQQDLISVTASIDQLYDVLPEGKAKEHAKEAKNILKKEKQKGAPKAKEQLEIVEEALDFNEVDLSVSYTSRLVKAAADDLAEGKIKEAGDALNAVADGLVFLDATVIAPADTAIRDIWLATRDYTDKDYKTATIRMGKAKTALQEVVKSGIKTQQAAAQHLIGEIDAIDVSKAGEKTGLALETLWQDARKLVDEPETKVKTEAKVKK